MKLIIAEKPSLARNIAEAIGKGIKKEGYIEVGNYFISWAFGHLFRLKDIDDYLGKKTPWKEVSLPFIPSFEFTLRTDKGIKTQFNIIKGLVHHERVSEIIHAGDSDREGQVIIDVLLKNAKNVKPVKRLWLPEQTEESILKALNHLENNDRYFNFYNEGLTRTYIDWLYGINLTRYITLKSGELLPCGRVLIPIVKYIYDRDLAIKNFKSEKYLALESHTKVEGYNIHLKDNNERFRLSERDKALEIAKVRNDKQGIIQDITTKVIEKRPPKLFSLSTLQSKLSKEYKMPFSESLKIIQGLYEKGFITYPRTNTEYLSNNEKDRVRDILSIYAETHHLELKEGKNIFDDEKIESHSAITITGKIARELNEDERKVYQTILYRFFANFTEEQTLIEQGNFKILVGDKVYTLVGETVISTGFLKYENIDVKNPLPKMQVGDSIPCCFKVLEKETQAPHKVTESELSNYLKNPFKKVDIEKENDDSEDYKMLLKGIEIGTEATRTGIIENAKRYGYIEMKKQSFSITEKGIYFIKALESLNINLFREKTVEISQDLKQIYQSTLTKEDLIKKTEQQLKDIIRENIELETYQKVEVDYGVCPRCGGKILKNTKSYYCANWKEGCKFSLWINNYFFSNREKKMTEAQAKKLIEGKEVILKNCKTKEGKTYDMKIHLEDNNDKVFIKGDFI